MHCKIQQSLPSLMTHSAIPVIGKTKSLRGHTFLGKVICGVTKNIQKMEMFHFILK